MSSRAVPRLFRLLLPAKNLAESTRFYETLLGVRGRRAAPGRVYFDCDPVILGVLDYSTLPEEERSRPTEALYFSTPDLETLFIRAKGLGCLSPELLHNDPASPAGKVVVRPWGERSFYAADPSGNPLCFVATETKFTGTPAQIAKLAASRGPRRRPRPSTRTPPRRRPRARR